MRKPLFRTAALLLALLCLGGCTSIKEEPATLEDHVQLTPIEQTGPEQEWFARLYFPQAESGRLLAETRQLPLADEAESAKAVLAALLRGPLDSSLKSLGVGLSLEGVEISGQVANAYINARVLPEEKESYILASAVADTLCGNFQVKYVNTFINGSPQMVSGRPLGALAASDGNVEKNYQEAVYRLSGDQPAETYVTLYFVDAGGKYILPEVRLLQLGAGDISAQLFGELALGPAQNTRLQSPFARDFYISQITEAPADQPSRRYYEIESQPFYDETDSAQTLAIACLYYTLSGCMDGCERITFEVGGLPRVTTRATTQLLLGRAISLYFPQVDLSTLGRVERIVPARRSSLVEVYLEELIRGPVEGDPQRIWPAFPEEITLDDVKSISVSGGTATLDFSDNFLRQLKKMSEKKQTLLIYSIVNSLCEMEDVRRVQFLVEGERAGEVSPRLYLYSPLLPSPGMVSEK
ncbi:MAG: GerMN domain-containing protein [Christensenellaceae bacterium]|nr:GerMN domain-containing protein [Christensenellaceae bacterium]